jgi:hypothetical protein
MCRRPYFWDIATCPTFGRRRHQLGPVRDAVADGSRLDDQSQDVVAVLGQGSGGEQPAEQAPGAVIDPDDVPTPVHHHRRERLVLSQHRPQRRLDRGQLGRVEPAPGIERCVVPLAAVTAESPTLLAAFDALRRTVAAGELEPRCREVAGLATGVALDNAYGVAFHSMVLGRLGVAEPEIDRMRSGRRRTTLTSPPSTPWPRKS